MIPLNCQAIYTQFIEADGEPILFEKLLEEYKLMFGDKYEMFLEVSLHHGGAEWYDYLHDHCKSLTKEHEDTLEAHDMTLIVYETVQGDTKTTHIFGRNHSREELIGFTQAQDANFKHLLNVTK